MGMGGNGNEKTHRPLQRGEWTRMLTCEPDGAAAEAASLTHDLTSFIT